MPPEMIRGKAYNHAVDWWALGALIYEMVTGYPPFQHKNRKKLHHKILNEKLSLPKWLSSDTHSILKQLLERNVDKRLGAGKSSMFKVKGVQAIKNHAFFRGIDWHLLAQKKLTPPIVPSVNGSADTAYFSEEFTKMPVGRQSRGNSLSADDVAPFARFSFVASDAPSFASIVAGSAATSTPANEDGPAPTILSH
jgi:p70 ribosomal S6 kinase